MTVVEITQSRAQGHYGSLSAVQSLNGKMEQLREPDLEIGPLTKTGRENPGTTETETSNVGRNCFEEA